ncbi:MAG: aspartyl protease family protein [bacterium]
MMQRPKKDTVLPRRISLWAVLLLLVLAGGILRAADLQEILDRHAEAIGGRERIESIQSLLIEAEVSLGGMKGSSNSYFKAPNLVRVELELPLMSYTQICDGDDCWMIDQQGLVTKLTAEFRGMLVTQEALERYQYLEPGLFPGQVQLAESLVAVDGFDCYQIDVLPDGGVPAQLFIDSSEFLIRQVAMQTDMARILSRPSNYREVEGLLMPYRTVESTDAGFVAGEITVARIEIDPMLSDTLFSLPARDASTRTTLADSMVVPFELFDNHIYLEIEIADSGPHSFIFDSGAGGIAIDRKLAASLNLESLGKAEARGVGGADSADVYVIPQLRLGELQLDSVSGFAVDLESLAELLEHPLAGIIGYELLSRFIITVDYFNQQLIIYDQATEPRDFWGDGCELSLDFRLPYMEMTVNDSIKGRFRIDTGARSTLDLNSPFVSEHHLLDTTAQEHLVYDIHGLGGRSSGVVALLPSLTVCGTRLDSLFVGYSLSTEGLFAGSAAAGNLGGGILKRFFVTFDYAGGRLYFKKSPAAGMLGRIRNMAGLRIAPQEGYFVVVEVLADGAATGKLEVGDRIVSIDGRSVSGLSESAVNWLMIDEKGRSVEIDIERQGKPRTERVVLQNLY